jgi:hypothetical protein
MSLKLTHKPTDWLFSVEEIIVDCEEQIKNYQKYTESALSDMARGYLSIYESRKEMALALQQKDTRFITVKAAYDQAPILDLNSALINGDFEYTLPSTFNTFSARPCSNQLQAYGAYYDLNHILEKSNQEVAEQAESLKNDTSKSYSTYSALAVATPINV